MLETSNNESKFPPNSIRSSNDRIVAISQMFEVKIASCAQFHVLNIQITAESATIFFPCGHSRHRIREVR